MFKSITQFSFPTTVVFGPGAVGRLPGCLGDAGIKKPLVVTDAGLVKTDAFKALDSALNGAGQGFALFSGVHPNPLEEDVEKGGEAYRNENCDGVIAIGGGSAMDAAKGIAVRVAHEGPFASFDAFNGGVERIRGPLPPIIAIPTTAGTGSEVGRAAVITIPSLGRKIIIFSPLLLAVRVVADPELTLGLPPHLTAATGMDAFTHNIESLTAPVFHPICDAVAVGGLELTVKYLERATKDGQDLEARSYMLIAAMMGAIAFQKDLGAAHSLAHPLSTEFGLHHGLANAVCLPAVMRFNREAAAKEYARVAAIFGIDTFDMADIDASDQAVEQVVALNQRLGIPARLRDCDVPEDALKALSHKAFEDPCHATNPRPCTADDLLRLYKESW